MPKHRFHYESDHTKGGTWFNDRGVRICDWSWDAQKKVLKIRRGPRGEKQFFLSGSDLETQESQDLGRRLAEAALEAAHLRDRNG